MTNKFISMMDGIRQGIASVLTPRCHRSDSLSIVSRQSLLPIFLLCLTLFIGAGQVWGATPGSGYTLITTTSDLSNGDKVIIFCQDDGNGVTGYNNNKDATVGTTKANWKEFVVGSKSNSGWTLQDASASKYIASPGGNEFKYGTSGGTCSVDGDGVLKCNNRYFCKNGSNYRFYSSIGTYKPFYVYKVSSSVAVTSVSVSPTSKSIVPGETFNITPTVLPDNASNKNINWSTSNSSKATVSNGTVTGVAAGTATITATSAADNTKTATCAVTVYGVTMQARDEDGNTIPSGGPGAPSRTGKSITPAADANNYVFKQWQVTNASLGSGESTKSNTITNPTGAVTVTAVYYKPITVTYKANGQDFTTQTYGHGGTLAFPASGPNGDTYSCTGKTFTGWVAEANKDYSHATTAPTYATASGSVTAAVTYYAVFATSSGSSKTYSFDITADDFNTTSYAANNNAKTTKATNTSDASDKIDVNWTSNQIYKNGGMQWQKSNGYIYNSTDLGTVNSVTVTSTEGGYTITYGTSANPTTGSQGTGKGFFRVKENGTATGKTSLIRINFTKSSYNYTNYETNCCEPLAQINGSVF